MINFFPEAQKIDFDLWKENLTDDMNSEIIYLNCLQQSNNKK